MKLEVEGIIQSYYDKEVSWVLGTMYIMDCMDKEKWENKE